MRYQLVTTKKGQFPLEEIEEGTEVLSHGEWKIAPKPVKSVVTTCFFDRLPATSFEKTFIKGKREVYCNHQPILNEFEGDLPELSIRGYLHENRKKDLEILHLDLKDISYWYPRLVRFFNRVVNPNIRPGVQKFTVYEAFPEIDELEGNELSERNLEYYLEGILRKRLFWADNTFKIPDVLDESDKIVLRLLDIDCLPVSNGTSLTNPAQLLKHVKDDYNKSKIDEDKIRIMLLKSYNLPQYTPGYKIKSRKDEEGWILPGINPDINCLSSYEWEYFDKELNPQVRRWIKTTEYDSKGRKLPVNKNNLFQTLNNLS